jgi:membrane-associated protease RseP (regulator of RpoE activity)
VNQRSGFINNIDTAAGVISIIGLLVSCYFGISVMINRLNDFRGTSNIIRKRIDDANNRYLKTERDNNKRIGEKTHKYLDRQIVIFAISVFSIIILEGFHILRL